MLQKQKLFAALSFLSGPLVGSIAFWVFSDPGQQWVGFLTLWMILWWMTECVPLWVPALFPLSFAAVSNVELVGSLKAFFHPVLLLFIGGFLLAKATEKTKLHYAVASLLQAKAKSGSSVLLSFVALTAFLSMWISNSAACLLMVPIAKAVAGNRLDLRKGFLLGVAYASSIGGLASVLGSPPNALFLAHADKFGLKISFFQWMFSMLPFCLVGLLLVWIYLGKVGFPSLWRAKLDGGDWQKSVDFHPTMLMVYGIFFAGLVLLSLQWISIGENWWIFAVGLSLFLIPEKGKFLLQIQDAKEISWGVLFIFAGGISLSYGLEKTGITAMITDLLRLEGIPPFLMLFAVVAIFILFTEVASNTAVAAIGIPLAFPLASALHLQPLQVAQAILFASSLSFMLPIATPPNAIAFSQGGVTAKEMAKIGWVMNLLFSLWITTWVYFFPMK